MAPPTLSVVTPRARHSLLGVLATGGALVVIGAFFTNAALYGFLVGRLPVPPLAWLLGVAALALICLAVPETFRLLMRTPILAWSVAFVTIVVLSYLLWSSQSEIASDAMRRRVVSGIAIVAFAALFAPPDARRAARWALIPLTVAVIPVEIYDLLHPKVFSNVIGRAAAMYVNPNTCGEALTIGVLFGHGLLRPGARGLFTAIAGFGVLLTLSRGGLIVYGVVVGILAFQGKISARGVVGGAVALAGLIVLVLLATGKLSATLDAARLLATKKDVIERVLNAQSTVEGGDASASLRLDVAQRAIGMFSDNPFLGKGTGATGEWELPIGPHNMYLMLAAEYGIVGLLLYPLLVLAICWRARGPERHLVWPIGVFFLLIGLVSHNVLDGWPDLVGLAMAAAVLQSWAFGESRTPPVNPATS